MNPQNIIEETSFAIVGLAYSANMAWWLVRETMQEHGVLFLQQIINGRAYGPYQYRMLSPWIVQGIKHLTGLALDDACLLYTIVAVLAFVYLARSLARDKWRSMIFWLVLPFVYVLPFIRYYCIPDVPALDLFMAGLLCLRSKKRAAYWIVFTMATWNRETSCFLTVAMLLLYGGKMRTWFNAASQGVLWLSIKAILFCLYPLAPTAYTHGLGVFKWSVAASHSSSHFMFRQLAGLRF